MNNQVLFIMGRATDSAQELTTKNGKDFTKFCVAVNDYKGKDIGSIAHFYDVVCFNRQSKAASKHVNKGDVIIVHGKPEVQAYESKSGELKAKLGVNANHVMLMNLPKGAVSDDGQDSAIED